MKRIHSKNLLLTTGFWAAVGQIMLEVVPKLAEFDKTGRFTYEALGMIFATVFFAIAGLIDRLDGNNTVLYTPDGIPGLNHDEAKALARTQAEATLTKARYFPKASDGDNDFWNPEED